MVTLVGLTAIVLGFVFILADDRIGGFVPRRPDAGATLSRLLGLILLVGGGLIFLHWAQP